MSLVIVVTILQVVLEKLCVICTVNYGKTGGRASEAKYGV